MKKIKLIYNPAAGDKSFKNNLDICIKTFQDAGYETHVFRSAEIGDIAEHVKKMPRDYYDAVAVSGGDGTLNTVINTLLLNGFDLPLCLLPFGTANDFATYLEIPKDPEGAANVINDGNLIRCDVGWVNGRYFLNVLAVGLLANVSQRTDKDSKDLFGKLAYYFEGLGQLGGLKPLSVRITNSEESKTEEIFFAIVLNSAGTGGFGNLVSDALINDGLFEFVALRACPMVDMAVLALKVLNRDFLNESNIIYFRDKYIKIEPLFKDELFMKLDTDGEHGGKLPAEIKNIPGALKIFAPKNFV